MCKSFKAQLHGVLRITEWSSPPTFDTNIVFTKNRIHLKSEQIKTLFDNPFQTNPINDNSGYVFLKQYNRDDKKQFAVKIEGHDLPFVLDITLWNKIRANILHHRYFIDKEKEWFLKTLIAAAIGFLFGIIGGTVGYNQGHRDGLKEGLKSRQDTALKQ